MRIPVLAAAAAALLFAGAAAAASYAFGTVIDNLDLRKVTKLHARDYCKGARGETVSWSGAVHDVKGGRNRAKIYVAEPSRPIYHGYNIVVTTDDLQRATQLNKGQRVKFKGQIEDCSIKDNGAVIDVENASIQ
jgi:hypothetical protein